MAAHSGASHFQKLALGQIRPKKKARKFDFSARRRVEIDRVINRRYGGKIPETDDASLYFHAMGRTVAASFAGEDDRVVFHG